MDPENELLDHDLMSEDEHDAKMREVAYLASDDYDDDEVEDPFLASARDDPDE